MSTGQVVAPIEAEHEPSNRKFPLYRILLIGVVIYFLAFGAFMSNLGGQPDQDKHLYYSERFSETWGIPTEDLQSKYRITGTEYLYYWLNGAVLKVFRFVAAGSPPGQETDLLRLVSLGMAAVTLVYVYKLASKVTGNRYAGVLAAFFLSNTLTFVFVSSGINYDNFMNLASAAAIYYLISLLKREDYVRNTTLMGIWLCLGSLAKEQTLLLAFILFVVWLVYSVSVRKRVEFVFNRANIALAVVFLASSLLLLGLYGGNVIHYGHLIPRCSQVKNPQVCTAFAERRPLYHAIDIMQLWEQRESIQNPFSYALNFWFTNMLGSIWGINSHNWYVPWLSISVHGLLILWAALCIVRYWKRGDQISTALLCILLPYAGYVLFMNYLSELHYDFRHFAVQGRYLSPVLGVLISLMINYFLQIRSLLLRRITLALSIFVYFAGGLGLFIFRYSQVFGYWRIYF